jgi:hypothetical protein
MAKSKKSPKFDPTAPENQGKTVVGQNAADAQEKQKNDEKEHQKKIKAQKAKDKKGQKVKALKAGRKKNEKKRAKQAEGGYEQADLNLCNQAMKNQGMHPDCKPGEKEEE